MENICSYWEINPITNRVRVRAPKTKEENYPDYDTEEDETAKMVAGLCNRTLPRGSSKKSRKRRAFSSSDEEEKSSEEEEESDEENGQYTIARNQRRYQQQEQRDFYDSEDSQDFEKSRSKRKFKKARRKKKPTVIRTTTKRGRKRLYKDVDVSSCEEDEPNRRHPIKRTKRKANKSDGYSITSSDFRKWRNSIHDTNNRSSKRSRKYYDSETTSNDEDSDVDESEESDNETRPKSKDARKKSGGRHNIARRADSRRSQSVIVENPAYKFKRQNERSKRSVGRVTTVSKPPNKSKSGKSKSGKSASNKNKKGDKGAGDSSEGEKSEYDSDRGDNVVENRAVTDITDFWTK
ncbi:Oidioi.mRNA.OKI2018_I69.chr2.g6162.t1.cds [Oikopleura dioica]|uniref:Oidioi.mRNA.OKI2018_I69.chr2.g6162.t1.cds n=1 Tax=Oikopleura dioica TaxID=34765 RepID=A0ABN7T331_OIKDI|nr:Oidioi.mRNA.OKI2018_I69.chr2.g6162.t1.cds [Oikopleura dioica]